MAEASFRDSPRSDWLISVLHLLINQRQDAAASRSELHEAQKVIFFKDLTIEKIVYAYQRVSAELQEAVVDIDKEIEANHQLRLNLIYKANKICSLEKELEDMKKWHADLEKFQMFF